MTEFHLTRMGVHFYEHTLPELVRQLARIADALEGLDSTRQLRAGEPRPEAEETASKPDTGRSPEEQINLDAIGAARLVNVSRAHWMRLVSSGRAPAGARLGSRRLWNRETLVSWCAAGCPSAAQYERMQRATRR